ncbi:hypothetical protein Ciccas_000839 [Cichlidogyrus casuarinus]|uniref:Uncharacterized protein n=1 Tax=Cichlidogyrus casuarinus TaxID=1844966 RepID=A0ABD2QLS7_9PLAT
MYQQHYHPLSFNEQAFKNSQQNLSGPPPPPPPPMMLSGNGGSIYGQHAHGMMHGDGDSVYSYFSQHDLTGHPQTPGSMHPQLNPLLEEGATPYGEAGSPAQAGQRHHRRRRRKQGPHNGSQYGDLGVNFSNSDNVMMQQMNGSAMALNSNRMMVSTSNDAGLPLPPPNQPPPPPPSFGNGMPRGGGSINDLAANKFAYPPKIRDYSEYGIPTSAGK